MASEEKSPKRPRLESIYIMEELSPVYRVTWTSTLKTVDDLLTQLEKEKAVVKQYDTIFGLDDRIPFTSADNPLQIITEFNCCVQVNGELKMERVQPMLYLRHYVNSMNLPLAQTVVLFKDVVLSMDTPFHSFFKKTSTVDYIKVVSRLSVSLVFQGSNSTRNDTCNLHGKSDMNHLLTIAARRLPTKLKSSDLLAFKDGADVTTSSQLIYTYDLTTPFTIKFRECSVEEKIDQMVCGTHPPSTYAEANNRGVANCMERESALEFKGVPLCYDRSKIGNDTSIYYEGFCEFVEQSTMVSIRREDTIFTNELCREMVGTFDNEEERLKIFKSLFGPYSGQNFASVQFESKARCDYVIGEFCALVEGKNELGSTKCDPLKQLTAYYLASLATRPGAFVQKCSCPCYLLELVGPQLTISSAVFGETAYVNRLIPPLYLARRRNNSSAMESLARSLRALKDALHEIGLFYSGVLKGNHPRQPRFPFPQNINGLDLEYAATMRSNMFTGTYNGKKVIIKFCERYGEKVHELLASTNLAPNLLALTKVGRFLVVVMEEAEGIPIDTYLLRYPDCKDHLATQLRKVLKTLKTASYCHGDLRPCNILVKSGGIINVLDFDWAGNFGDATYPYFLNHAEIKWPEGVDDNAPITFDHDKHWIERCLSI